MGYDIRPPHGQVLCPITHDDGGSRCSVTFGIDWSAGGPQDAVNEAWADFVDAWEGVLDSQAQFEPATMYYRAGIGDPLQEVLAAGSAAPGLASGAAPPPNVAWILKKRTSFVGRQFRGRIYFPWAVNEGGVNELGILSGGAISTRQTAAEGWLAAANSASDYEGLWLMHNEDGPTVLPTRITALEVASMVGTQRRRLQRQ